MQSKDFFSRGWSRWEILSIQGLKPVRKIAYANVWSSKPEQGNKYNVPHLKVSLEAFFPEIIRVNKEVFIFRQGNCTMNVLHPSLSKSFALSICSRGPMKNSTLGYFCKSTYRQIYRKLQPWWLFGRQLLCSVLQVETSHPHTTSHILFAKGIKNLRRKWLRKFRFAK